MSHYKKSERREMTHSSDENSGKLYSKKSYSHRHSDKMKSEKHKKRAVKNLSEPSSESDGDYRKENKASRKHKKKSSKEKYEHYSQKRQKSREKSQERQRYGKWADAVDRNKNTSDGARWKGTDSEERSSKRLRKDFSDDCSRDTTRYLSDENDENSHRIFERKHESKNYHRNSDFSRRDVSSDKHSRNKNKYEIEEDDNRSSHRFRSEYDDRENYQKNSNWDRNDLTPNKYSKNKNKHNLDEENSENSHRGKHSYSRKKMSQSYEDNPNGSKEVTGNEDNLNTDDAKLESTQTGKDSDEPLSKRQKIGNINMRTGGAYIPPAKLRMMQEKIKDKSSEEYQRIAWEALKKSIVGMTNKVNSSNIAEIVQDLFKENIIRGRGVLARAIMQAQGASPTFTRVYAALVSIINTKFPEIGELILKRLIIQYKRGFRRNDKTVCMTATRFLAHLLNQEVAHEVLILEIVTHLLENPTEDSVEIAICTLKECGKKLTQLTARGMRAITQRVRDVLHEGSVDQRVRYMIEVFFAVQKDGFKDFEIIPPELDLVEDEDKYTHLINLDEQTDAQEMLNIFNFDPEYLENEEKYKSVVKEILGDSDEEGSGASGSEEDDDEENGPEEEKKEENQQIIDMTETNIVCLRRKIYLTIQSSLDFEECAHKLLKLELKPGQILEMCYMILDCCAQQRTYEKFFGLLAQRFCQLNKIYVEPFTEIFENSYKTIHRLETNKLRNVAKFFAHLLYTDAISWEVLSIIKLNEEDTTSSSRIFIKILFQELCEYMGLPKLNERVKDVTLQEAFDGLFPRDHPHNTRFAINFFTSIGLGGLTDELREHLKNLPKNPILPVAAEEKASSAASSSSTSSTASSSSSSSSSDSD